MVPDFSPIMLKAFLRVRVDHAARMSARHRGVVERAQWAAMRRAAGVSRGEFWNAWNGKLEAVAPRLRLWASLGIVPGDFGVMLMDDGTQCHVGDGGQEQMQ